MTITTTDSRFEHMLDHLDGLTVRRTSEPRPHRRPSLLPVLLAAVLALTAVAVADRVEQSLAPTNDVDANETTAPAAGPAPDASSAETTPLASAALPAGEMVLTLTSTGAAISTGANDAIFELGTDSVGDLDLTDVEPTITQTVGEVSADFGDVTEWFRTDGGGIEHGYTVDAPVAAGDQLTVTVDVTDATLTLVDNQTVAIARTDGSTVWYRGLYAFDANGIDLPAEMAVVDGDIELRIDTAGAAYPLTIDPTIADDQELSISTPEAFSGSVGAIDEARGRMIVGGGVAATIFELVGGIWTPVQELVPATVGPPQGLLAENVSSVDISGDVAVIGSTVFGTVEIYDRDAGGVWSLSQTLASGDDGFGSAVGVGDGENVDIVFTGAPQEPWTGTPDPGPNGGRIGFYTRTAGAFSETFSGLGTRADFFQGAAVDVEHLGGDDFSYGWTLTGGLNWVIVTTVSWNGATLTFDTTNTVRARYSAADLPIGSGFGGDLDIEGTSFAVGADAAYAAFVYDMDGPVSNDCGVMCTELFPTAAFGGSGGSGLLSVALGTETLAVGASTAGGGSVELFDFSPVSNQWSTSSESFQPAGYSPIAGGDFGRFVALSGRTIAAGDPLADVDVLDDQRGRAFTALATPVALTFVGPGVDWNDPANWDVSAVPIAGDIAVVPAGSVDLSSSQAIGQLVVQTGATLTVQNGATLTVTGGDLADDALVVEGTIVNDGGALISFGGTGSQTVSGNGTIQNFGTISQDGLNNAVVFASPLTIETNEFSQLISAVQGTIQVDTAYVEGGTVRIAPGANVTVSAPLNANDAARYVFEVSGASDSTANYGTLDVTNAAVPQFGGAAVLVDDGGSASGTYPIITCVDCGSGTFIAPAAPFLTTVFTDRVEVTAVVPPVAVTTLADAVSLDGACSLREAIAAVNSNDTTGDCFAPAGVDTINFAVDGTISLASRLPVISSNVTIDGSGRDVTISGGGATSVLFVNAGANLTLDKLTVADGRQQGCIGGDTCGAVLNYGTLEVRGSTFSGNNATGLGNGAAITNRGGGTLTVDSSTFANNSAAVQAGAIWNASGNPEALTVATITNSTFVGNSGGGAGAIYNTFQAQMTIINSTIVGAGGSVTLNNAGGAAPVTLRNTIVTSPSGGGAACGGPDGYSADGFNFDDDGSCGSAATSAALNLGSLADNGGPTETVNLLAGSEAIDAGDGAVCAAPPINGTDQRGAIRPASAGCDVGAVETGLTVTGTGDASDAIVGDGICDTGLGECTLRAAIQEANGLAGADTIGFAIPGVGVQTISPLTPLPAITDTVTIDGYTQAGSSRNTLAVGNDAVLLIEINGQAAPGADQAGSDQRGLYITQTAPNTTITGLVINGHSDGFWGFGIWTQYVEGVVIEGNFIGTDATGTAAVPNRSGVHFVDIAARPAPSRVGGSDPAQRNLISGNTVYGIDGSRFDTGSVNVIQGNYIGTNASGTAALGNGSAGVRIEVQATAVIGGTGLGEGNLISGNGAGISAQERPTIILGNLIGTDATGLLPVPNGVGIALSPWSGSPGSPAPHQIGDGTPEGRNVISGNSPNGAIDTALPISLRGNYLGVGIDGTTALGNSGSIAGTIYLRMNSAGGSVIGGQAPGDGNLFANNVGSGGVVTINPSTGNTIVGNSFVNNAAPSINLAGGSPAENDPGDADTGPNNQQNYPVFDATINGDVLTVNFDVDSLESASAYPIQVDFYRSVAGQGDLLVGTATLASPGASSAVFAGASAQGIAALVATATDDDGNTSRFSPETAVTVVTTPTYDLADGSWFTAANWSTGAVPAAGEDAIVPTGANVTIPAGQVAEVGSIELGGTLRIEGELQTENATVESTGTLTVIQGAVLEFSGNLQIDSGGFGFTFEANGTTADGVIRATDGASFTGDGNVSNSGTVITSGDVTIGSDLTWNSGLNSLIEVRSGVLDIQPAFFGYQGEIFVAAGAVAQAQGAVALVNSSVFSVGITGDDSDSSNYGQIQLVTSDLNASGTLRTQVFGYDATFDDVYPVITCAGGDCVGGTQFDTFDIAPFTASLTPGEISLRGPSIPVSLAFGLDLAAGAPTSLAVAPTGIEVIQIDRQAIARDSGETTNVAASSITSIGPEDTSLASIPLSAIPLSAIVLDSENLSAIPLVNIDIEGGWERIVALSDDLLKEPLSSLTFGQVLAAGDPSAVDYSETPAGVLASTPLSAIDVNDTPLSAIPLSAIALGATPLSAIPLSAIGFEWCAVVSELIPDCTDADLQDLTLLEVTLSGVPLSAIPLSAIPLSAIDLAKSPLSAIPLSAINLGATPLSAIPLSAIPLSAIGVEGSPLSAIPLSAIPLSAIPLSAIPLSAIDAGVEPLLDTLTSIPLSAIPLSAIDIEGAPLSAIELAGTPLSAIPLSAIVLADTPLSAIPLSAIGGASTDWCATLAEAGYPCIGDTYQQDTTLRELSVRGVPLSAIPLSAIPLSAIDIEGAPLSAIPLSAIPLSAIPLSAIPLSAIPLSAIELGATPLSAIPLSAIPLSAIDVQGSPLSAIPLSAIPLSAIPLSAIPLSAIPLSAIPLSAIPLSAIEVQTSPLSAIPLSAIDVLGTPLSAIPLSAIPLSAIGIDCDLVDCERGTLGDAINAGAVPEGTPLSAIEAATSGIRLNEIADAFFDFDRAALIAALGTTTATLEGFDDLSLGDLPSDLDVLQDVELGDLASALNGVTFDDIIDALIDSATGRSIPGVEQDLRNAVDEWQNTAGDLGALGDLLNLGDITLGELLENGPALTLSDITPVLGFLTVDAFQRALNTELDLVDTPLGELTDEQAGQLTLADVAKVAGDTVLGNLLAGLEAEGLLDGLTLGDILLALLDPSSLAYGGVEFAQVEVSTLPPGTVGSTTFDAAFTLTASTPRPVELDVTIPRSASFIEGSGRLVTDAGSAVELQPDVIGDVLRWSFTADPGVNYTITFDVLPTLTLGSTSLGGNARVVGTDVSVPASAAVTVVEGIEPNDFNVGGVDVSGSLVYETTDAVEDVVYLTYIPDATDIDVFEITVEEDDQLIVELSNLDADLDLVLWGRASGAAGGALAPTSDEEPLFAITDPDGTASNAEPLADFPRLDETDPTLGIVAVSNQSGTNSETISTDRLDAGTYFIQVYGANGATTVQPAALQLKVLEADVRPECVAIDLEPFNGVSAVKPDLGGADTLLLINERRLEQVHTLSDRTEVRAAADRLVAAAKADPSLGITPVVVPVDAYPTVQAAYDNWDSMEGSCDPDAANAVVAAINEAIIDPVRSQLDHVTILGPDEIIPMARLADKTVVANEYDYRHEFDGDLTGTLANGRNAFTSTMWESSILSDEPYGDAAARSLGDRYLYVTDLGLGRVVETPAEIVDALDTYVTFNGNLDIDTATVLGYDFLADGSEAIADELQNTLTVDRELAAGPDPRTPGDGWDANRATDKLRDAATNALVSLNAHFDHYRALPAIGDKVPAFEDNLIAQAVRDELGEDALAQSLIFSMGCHSGLSVSNITIGITNADWAQTLGQQGSLYVGNTGFGYGDTETVAYTEQLMLLFAQQVTAPLKRVDGTSTTVGQALAWAKNQFVAELQTFSVYDEKAVMESTFYGLPFYRIGGADDSLPALPAPPANVTELDSTGTPSIQETLEATVTNDRNEGENDGGRGTYYSNTDAQGNELVIVAPGQPLQPKVVRDISVVDRSSDLTTLSEVARGAIVLDQTSEYVSNLDPVIATPVFDEELSQSEPELTSGVFPTKPVAISTSTGPAGERQQLVLATGQFDSETGIQRLDDDIDVVIYYAPTEANGGTDDFTPPTIGAVTSSVSGDSLSVSLTAGAAPGDGVDRVYLLVAENPGEGIVDWRGLDLGRVTGTNRWTGSLELTAGTTAIEFVVQAKDAAGNVGYATNKAQNFGQLDTPPAPPPPPPPPTELSVVVPDEPGSGWFTDSVEILIESAATPASVSVNGVVRPETLSSGDTFIIDDDGEQNWVVVTAAGRPWSGTVKIDADGAPDVALGIPAQAGTPKYASGTRNVDVIFRDTSPIISNVTIDDVPVANGDPLPATPGNYLLQYEATDAVGNSVMGSADFIIEAVTAAPVISSSTIPADPQPIADGVTVSALFTDASLPFDQLTAKVDWGDDTIDTVTPTLPNGGEPVSVTATHAYGETGSYEVTITVADDNGLGLSDSVKSNVVVYDPEAAPVLGDLDVPRGDPVITDPIDIAATFIDKSTPVDSFTASIDWGDGTVDELGADDIEAPTLDGAGTIAGSHLYAVPDSYTVTVTVRDESGFTDEIGAAIDVKAPAGVPVIETITGPTTPQQITDTVSVSASFGDTSAPFDEFTATVDWGDGTESPAAVTAPTAPNEQGLVAADHIYTETGVYPVTITVTDREGDFDTELYEFVVVYDPETRARVSGSGFYWSSKEAYAGTSGGGSPAFFGYNARYKNGADEPSGRTKLRLLGEFYFRSTSYDYLIVNEAMAIAEGEGTIGSKNYRFRVQGIDQGWLDFFQITIWDPVTEEVLYDNGVIYEDGDEIRTDGDVVLLGGIRVRGG